MKFSLLISVLLVQSLNQVQLFANPWTAARQSPMFFTISQSLLTFMSIEFVVLSDHLTFCHTHLLLPSIFPSIWSFPLSVPFGSRGQSIGASTSASVLPLNIQGLFPLGLTGLISLQTKGLSEESSPATQFESINSLALSLLYDPSLTSVHDFLKNHN